MYIGDCACLGILYLCFARSWSANDEHYLHCGDSGEVINVLHIAT